MRSQNLLPLIFIRLMSSKRNLMIDFPSRFLLKTIMHRSFEERMPFVQHSNALDGRNSLLKEVRNRNHVDATGVAITMPRVEVKISAEGQREPTFVICRQPDPWKMLALTVTTDECHSLSTCWDCKRDPVQIVRGLG